MNVKGLIVCLMALVVMAGCNPPGMNKKLALSDALGVTATGATLDEAKDFDKTRAEVIEIAMDLDKFVQDGSMADLPIAVVRKAITDFLIKKGKPQYIYLVDSIMAYVKTIHVPTEAIGADNVLLIRTGIEGILRQAKRSKAEWAVPWVNGVTAPRPSRTADL